VELRKRYLKLLQIKPKQQPMCLVAQVVKGELVTWTIIPITPSQINKERQGKLLWKRE
jgi:hypothetical protein